MKTSAAGRVAIIAREGKRLVAYHDSVGVLTIGVGHTGRTAPPKVTPGMRISEIQCNEFLAADLVPVERALTRALKVEASQNQFDALASLIFNVGIGYAHEGMAIIKALNAGDAATAAKGFDLFHRPPDIIGRRNGEKAQFLTPDAAFVALRPAPSAATPIIEAAIHATPVPPAPARGPSPAPASAAPAAKESTMSNINFGAGFANVFENLAHSIFTGAAAVESPDVETRTSSGNPIVDFGADIADAKRAGSEILEIVGDFRSKNLVGGVDDAIDLARIVFGALDRHGVKVPIVTDAIKSIDLDPAS